MSDQNEAEKFPSDDVEKLADEYVKTYCALSNDRETKYAKYDFTNGYIKASKVIASKQSRISELEQQIAKSDKEEHDQFTRQQSRIEELEREVERLKQSVEYWQNQNSRTGNLYIHLLEKHNELKSELESIKNKNK